MLRPAEAVFESTLLGFREHQKARNLQDTTVNGRESVIRQVQAVADAYPWEPTWNAALFDRWMSLCAPGNTSGTLGSKARVLRLYLEYLTNPAYQWQEVCLNLFGTFPAQVVRDLNAVRHSQDYVGRPNRNRPLTRQEIKRFFSQMDPEIKRMQAAGHKGALAAARDVAMFTTAYAWGLRRRETARLETHDWRRQAKLPEFGDLAGLSVRWGKASAGQPPRRRTVVSVWPWAVATVRFYLDHVRPQFYLDRPDDGVMFPTERHESISERSVNARFATWRDRASLSAELDPHCLRHTYVTRLIESGYDTQFVTEQVGHSHAATTAIYTALSSDYKNLKVREFLDAQEEKMLHQAFARADAEAQMEDEFEEVPGEPRSNRRRA